MPPKAWRSATDRASKSAKSASPRFGVVSGTCTSQYMTELGYESWEPWGLSWWSSSIGTVPLVSPIRCPASWTIPAPSTSADVTKGSLPWSATST